MDYLLLIEIFSYIFYIYGIIVFSIFIKPNIYIAIIFFICRLITTWLIIDGCKSNLIRNRIIRAILLIVYAALCLCFYYMIHHTWDIYKNNMYYTGFMLISPVIFYSIVKFLESFFQCNNYHIITTPLRYLKPILPLLKSFLNIN